MNVAGQHSEAASAVGAAVRAALLVGFAGALASAWPVPWKSVVISNEVAGIVAYVFGLGVVGTTFQILARRAGRVPGTAGGGVSVPVSGHWHTTIALIVVPPAAALAYAWCVVAPLGFDLHASTSSPWGSVDHFVVPVLYLIAGPLVEEFYFREVVYREFEVVYGSALLYVPANAIWFTSIHSPAALPNAFILGVCCSLLRRRSGGLALPVLVHVLTNAALELAGKLQ